MSLSKLFSGFPFLPKGKDTQLSVQAPPPSDDAISVLFDHLSFKDLCRMALVSKKWKLLTQKAGLGKMKDMAKVLLPNLKISTSNYALQKEPRKTGKIYTAIFKEHGLEIKETAPMANDLEVCDFFIKEFWGVKAVVKGPYPIVSVHSPKKIEATIINQELNQEENKKKKLIVEKIENSINEIIIEEKKRFYKENKDCTIL